MSDRPHPCECVVDVYGLRAICALPSSIRQKAFSAMKNGKVRCLARAWEEFETLFPDLAETYDGVSMIKLAMKDKYSDGAALIVEKSDSDFLDRPYDSYTDWYTASVCKTEGWVLVTGDDNFDFYADLKACKVKTAIEYF